MKSHHGPHAARWPRVGQHCSSWTKGLGLKGRIGEEKMGIEGSGKGKDSEEKGE